MLQLLYVSTAAQSLVQKDLDDIVPVPSRAMPASMLPGRFITTGAISCSCSKAPPLRCTI